MRGGRLGGEEVLSGIACPIGPVLLSEQRGVRPRPGFVGLKAKRNVLLQEACLLDEVAARQAVVRTLDFALLQISSILVMS